MPGTQAEWTKHRPAYAVELDARSAYSRDDFKSKQFANYKLFILPALGQFGGAKPNLGDIG
jgi:hypothetical protein